MQDGGIRRLLTTQCLLVVGLSALLWMASGIFEAQSALYGGGIALLSSWMLGRRVYSAADVAEERPGKGVAMLYFGAIQRFVIVLGLFALGIGLLKLAPLPLIGAFAVAQLGFIFVTR
ncbi:MAG: ATP synthase subunit I [Gammaproteobacteria bacterium]|nr:ATP synthase subunit I [Gammaproteobacteria bacterium]